MATETEHEVVPQEDSTAVLIQKLYRGYRVRRKLADAAIMSKKMGWWNVVDAAVLHQHTLQYYAHSKSWKANDNWRRLKRKASKLGKGLEKNNKALKLALNHWLEAIDARHRYGHNLRPYYLHWHDLETTEPFFYWLDLGDGRQVELPKCSRATLHEQQITYLSPDQRRHYEVAIYHGKLYYQSSGELVHTSDGERWIFVMSPSLKLYIGKKVRGKFQHSSFFAGGATTAAGRLEANHGMLKLMEAHSGHYRPSPENFEALVGILVSRGADLHLAKVQLVSDDVLEEKKAKTLAKEVREAIESRCDEGHVEVKVEDQRLVTADSGFDCRSQYIVTNVTFPELEGTQTTDFDLAAAGKPAEANAGESKDQDTEHVPNGGSVPPKLPVEAPNQEPAIDQPVPNEAAETTDLEEKPVPSKPEGAAETTDSEEKPVLHKREEAAAAAEEEAVVVEENVSVPCTAATPADAADAAEAAAAAVAEEKPVHKVDEAEASEPSRAKTEIVEEHILVRKTTPSALMVPGSSVLEPEVGDLDPKTAALPSSPGFSRISHLANLGLEERRQTLKKYGPRKIAFGTKLPETVPQAS